MSRAVNTWSCASCGTAAFADQNFCRICGAPRDGRRPAPITQQIPIVRRDAKTFTRNVQAEPAPTTTAIVEPEPAKPPPPRRPLSRAAMLLIAVLFIGVGGVTAVIVNHIRGNVPDNPSDVTIPQTTQPAPTTTAAPTTTTIAPTTTTAPATTTTVETTTTSVLESTTVLVVPAG